VKLGLKGNELGWPIKPKKAAVSGPTKLAFEVRSPSSSQQPHPEEPKQASEVQLGGSGAKFSKPEQEVGKSPSSRLGESPPLSTLPVCEDCVDASSLKSGGFGAGVMSGSSSPVMSKVGVEPSSDFGLPVVNIAETSSMTLFASATPEIFPLTPERAEAATLFSGLPEVCRWSGVAGHWGSRRVVCAR
jgi:hypothetical protein